MWIEKNAKTEKNKADFNCICFEYNKRAIKFMKILPDNLNYILTAGKGIIIRMSTT